jgi:hypothetical protein
MPRLRHNVSSSLRFDRASGQAVVTLNGRDIYLGKHGSDESRAEYERRIAEWHAAGRHLPKAPADLTINEFRQSLAFSRLGRIR